MLNLPRKKATALKICSLRVTCKRYEVDFPTKLLGVNLTLRAVHFPFDLPHYYVLGILESDCGLGMLCQVLASQD